MRLTESGLRPIEVALRLKANFFLLLLFFLAGAHVSSWRLSYGQRWFGKNLIRQTAKSPGPRARVPAPGPRTLVKYTVFGPRPPKHLKHSQISMKFDG